MTIISSKMASSLSTDTSTGSLVKASTPSSNNIRYEINDIITGKWLVLNFLVKIIKRNTLNGLFWMKEKDGHIFEIFFLLINKNIYKIIASNSLCLISINRKS